MKVVIQNTRKIRELLNNFVKNKKVLVNLECDGRVLSVQILNEYTVCTSMGVDSLDGDFKKMDISFYLTKVINVLTDEPITLTFSQEAIYMEQGTFSGIFIKEYEARRVFPIPVAENLTKISTNKLKAIISNSLALGSVFKELKVFEPDPVIVGNKYFMNATANSNIVYFDNLDFPTCCIPIKSLKECVYSFKSESSYQMFTELSTIYFMSGEYDYWIPTMNYNIEGNTIREIEKILSNCNPLTNIDLYPYVDSKRVQLIIGDGKFQIQVNLNDATLTIGDEINSYLCSLSITTGTLNALTKIYSDEGTVKVSRGVNCLLIQRDDRRNVLLSALIN